jgi:hypothetical protein
MWQRGAQQGQGELRYADGSLYFGDFVNNVQQGAALYCIVLYSSATETALLCYWLSELLTLFH